MAWPADLLKAKGRAWAIHLGISAVVFLPFLWLLLYRWFPAPLFVTDGGWQGLRIMLAVDVVLGPLLTLVIYNPAKSRREKWLDFSCIGLVQAGALLFGAYNIEHKRPWTLAWHEGAFSAITHDTYANQPGVSEEAWRALGDGPIYWAFVREPRSAEEAAGMVAFNVVSGVPTPALLFLYEPFSRHWEALRSRAQDMAAVSAQNPELGKAWAALQARHTGRSLLAFMLNGYYRAAYIVLDDEGRYVDALYL